MAARQKFRLTLLFFMFFTFPITLNYFSVYLIMESGSKGIANFSLFLWIFWVLVALVLGRVLCGYFCPLGAIQEVKDRMGGGRLRRVRYLKVIKYVLAVAWVGAVVWAVIYAGGYHSINLRYNTENFVSVDSAQSLVMFYIIAFVPLIPALFMGKRSFCRYFCPWGVLNTVSTRIKNFFGWKPSLNLKADSSKCEQCHTCEKACTMSLPVTQMVQSGNMDNGECILCGSCVDNCPRKVISYTWSRPPKKA